MKIFFLLVGTCAVIFTRKVLASPTGPVRAPLDIISLDDITLDERKEIAYLEHKLGRPKRSGSGSGDILGILKNAIGRGIKKKVGQIAVASASASAHFSSSSSNSGGGGHSYHYPEHVPESHDHKSIDFWSLKKSILNTLLQAVKAIKGGVIAVKGQLIKGSGKLISAKGKLISYKGDAITKLGKNIATSAVLVPYHGHPSSGHGEYGPSESHYSAPSAPEEIYHGSPSAPGPEYQDYHSHEGYAPSHHGGADGLLIVKKLPSGHHHRYVEDAPAFKPLEPTGPSFGSIVGKFFSASSSFDPHQPEPFGNTASADTHHKSHYPKSNYYHHDYHDNEVAPSAASGLVTLGKQHVIDQQKPVHPTTSYGTPFEEAPSYLNQNFDEFSAAASKKNTKFIEKLVGDLKKNKPSTTSVSFYKNDESDQTNSYRGVENPQSISHLNSNPSSTSGQSYNPSFEENPVNSQSMVFINNNSEFNQLNPTSSQVLFQNSFQSPTSNFNSPSSSKLSFSKDYDLPNIADYPDGYPSKTENFPVGETLMGYLDQNSQSSQVQSVQQPLPNPSAYRTAISSPSPYLESPKTQNVFLPTPNIPYDLAIPTKQSYSGSPKYKYMTSRRPSSISASSGYRKSPKSNHSNLNIVKSISYELGPHGPKRLT